MNQKLSPNPNYSSKPPKNYATRRLIIIIVLAVLAIVSLFATKVIFSARNATNDMYSAANKKVSMRDVNKLIKNKKPFTILLLGVDTGEEGRTEIGRSDSMVVATVNPTKKQVTMLSIPRDTKTVVTGFEKKGYAKINSAYTYGAADGTQADGAATAMNTVQTLLDIPIDFYAQINMKGLEQIVDAVGGVDVKVPFSFAIADATFKKGNQHLDGHEALLYARMRHDDPEGDYGRQKRQQQVITSIVHSAISVKTLFTYEKIFNKMSKNVKTDLSFNDMAAIQQNYQAAATNIVKDQMQGYESHVTGTSYQIMPASEIARCHKLITTQVPN